MRKLKLTSLTAGLLGMVFLTTPSPAFTPGVKQVLSASVTFGGGGTTSGSSALALNIPQFLPSQVFPGQDVVIPVELTGVITGAGSSALDVRGVTARATLPSDVTVTLFYQILDDQGNLIGKQVQVP